MPNPSAQEEARQVYECITAIAANCDGAITQDRVGFNGSDTKFGRRVAAIPFEEWTPDILNECARILGNTYRVQAQGYTGIDARTLQIVRDNAEVYTNHAARQQARDFEKKATAASKRTITVQPNRLAGPELLFKFPYDDGIRVALKSAGKFRWNSPDKTWRILAADVNQDVVAVALANGFRFDDEIDEIFSEAKEIVPPAPTAIGTVELEDAHLLITLKGHLGGDLFRHYRALAGYKWIHGSQQSTVDVTEGNLKWLAAQGFSGTEGIWDAFKVKHAAFVARQEAKAVEAEARLATSRAAESDLDLSHVVPEGLAPYPFQVAGVEYALKTRRTFIGDEMGLGKTVQAILAVEAARAARNGG